MLKSSALEFYESGYDCCRCILLACDDYFKLNLSRDFFNSSRCFYNGLGIGHCCGAVLAGLMVISTMCEDFKFYRLEFLDKFQREFKSYNCCYIKNNFDCEKVIEFTCQLILDIIDKSYKKN